MTPAPSDLTRNPLPPTDSNEISKVFDFLMDARTVWQAHKDPDDTMFSPFIKVILRIAVYSSLVLFIAAIILLGIGQGAWAIAALALTAAGALTSIFVSAWAFSKDIQRVSTGNEGFKASLRHTLEVNVLSQALSQCSLPALRLVRRSRNREYEAVGTMIAYFTPTNFQAFITQLVAVVALITSVLGLFLGKDNASFSTLTPENLYIWFLIFAVIGGFVLGAFFALAALNNSRPWVRKELVALEDAIVNLEQSESKLPLVTVLLEQPQIVKPD